MVCAARFLQYVLCLRAKRAHDCWRKKLKEGKRREKHKGWNRGLVLVSVRCHRGLHELHKIMPAGFYPRSAGIAPNETIIFQHFYHFLLIIIVELECIESNDLLRGMTAPREQNAEPCIRSSTCIAIDFSSRVYRARRALCVRSKSTIIYHFHVLQNRRTVNNFSPHFLVSFCFATYQHVFVHLLTHFADLKRSLTHKLFI